MLVNHPKGRAGHVGTAAGKHLVKDNTEAIEIRAFIHRDTMALFWTHVIGSAEDFSRSSNGRLQLNTFRQTKINECETAILPEHHIRWFEVAMQYTGPVYGLECTGNLDDTIERGLRSHRDHETFSKTSGVEVLHNDKGMIIRDA